MIGIIIGLILIFLAIRMLNDFKLISKEGVEVEGIIFGFEQSSSTGTSVSYPIVRFLTLEKEWITQITTIGITFGFYKKGEKIKIIYQKKNPKKFYIKNKKTFMVPFTIIIIALIFIILEVLKLTNVIS